MYFCWDSSAEEIMEGSENSTNVQHRVQMKPEDAAELARLDMIC